MPAVSTESRCRASTTTERRSSRVNAGVMNRYKPGEATDRQTRKALQFSQNTQAESKEGADKPCSIPRQLGKFRNVIDLTLEDSSGTEEKQNKNFAGIQKRRKIQTSHEMKEESSNRHFTPWQVIDLTLEEGPPELQAKTIDNDEDTLVATLKEKMTPGSKVEMKKSSIVCKGKQILGLFSFVDLKAHEVLTKFEIQEQSICEKDREHDKRMTIKMFDGKVFFLKTRPACANHLGYYANAAREKDQVVNCIITSEYDGGKPVVWLQTITTIKAGQELFLDYGPDFVEIDS